MENTKPVSNPLQSGVKLSIDYLTLLCDPTLYRQLISSLIYLTYTCPDISYAVALCSCYMQEPHKSH